MSLLPYLLGCDISPSVRVSPLSLFDQDFGLALTPEDLLTTASITPVVTRGGYLRPWRQAANLAREFGSSIKSDKDKFQVNLDVQHFSPEEISVKTADGFVIVEGKHEEKEDSHGYISRQFTRRYALPEGCKPELVESKLSSDGVLTIIAPKVTPQLKSNERSVPIAQTGPVRKEIKNDSSPASAENGTK